MNHPTESAKRLMHVICLVGEIAAASLNTVRAGTTHDCCGDLLLFQDIEHSDCGDFLEQFRLPAPLLSRAFYGMQFICNSGFLPQGEAVMVGIHYLKHKGISTFKLEQTILRKEYGYPVYILTFSYPGRYDLLHRSVVMLGDGTIIEPKRIRVCLPVWPALTPEIPFIPGYSKEGGYSK